MFIYSFLHYMSCFFSFSNILILELVNYPVPHVGFKINENGRSI